MRSDAATVGNFVTSSAARTTPSTRSQARRAEHGHQRDPRLLLSRRYPRELSLDEVEVVGDLREVGAREVDPI
jgi:hypothetical protein